MQHHLHQRVALCLLIDFRMEFGEGNEPVCGFVEEGESCFQHFEGAHVEVCASGLQVQEMFHFLFQFALILVSPVRIHFDFRKLLLNVVQSERAIRA